MPAKITTFDVLNNRVGVDDSELLRWLQILGIAAESANSLVWRVPTRRIELGPTTMLAVFHYAGAGVNDWSTSPYWEDIKPWWRQSDCTEGLGLYQIPTSAEILVQFGIDSVGYVWGSTPAQN